MIHSLLKISPKVVFLPAFLFMCSLSFAHNYPDPDTIKGITIIDAESLIELAQKHDDLVIIDSRIRADRRQGYIAGSVSLPDTETDCVSLLLNIDKKDTATVFYCNGLKCHRSYHAVIIARECGYTNIFWFRGGLEEWKNNRYLIRK